MLGSHVRNALVVLMMVALAACSSSSPQTGSRPGSIQQPDIDLALASSLFFGSGSTAPATVEVTVTNRASVPITVRRIDVESPNMTQYTVRRAIKDFREVIEPGQSKTLPVFSSAVTTIPRPTESLTLRAVVSFEAGELRWREMVIKPGMQPTL